MVTRRPAGLRSICNWYGAWVKAAPSPSMFATRGRQSTHPASLSSVTGSRALTSRIRSSRWVFVRGVHPCLRSWPSSILKVLRRPQVVDWVRARPDTKVSLHVERDGAQLYLPLTLAARGEGKATTGYLGAGVKGADWPPEMLREVSYGPLAAIQEGARRTWTMSVLTLDSLRKILFGELSVKNLSGPITIAKVAGASAQSGVGDFLNFLAYLSISLGVLNLLPIPVLDGGHLLFYLIEWARGRPLSERVQGWGIQIGISLVVGVMLLALVNDLGRL